jgi:Domain of unknown function (DUF4863)
MGIPSLSPREQFESLMACVAGEISGRTLDERLEADLNRRFPTGGQVYRQLLEFCKAGIREGWMCSREAGGIRFGRVIKPSPSSHGFSVDVVDMPAIAGPHHSHPNGEIDLVMPLERGARFDGLAEGWLVYRPGSSHQPTVSGGRALVLYLLPAGAIEFTRA